MRSTGILYDFNSDVALLVIKKAIDNGCYCIFLGIRSRANQCFGSLANKFHSAPSQLHHMYVLPRLILGSVSDTPHQPCLHELEYVKQTNILMFMLVPRQIGRASCRERV